MLSNGEDVLKRFQKHIRFDKHKDFKKISDLTNTEDIDLHSSDASSTSAPRNNSTALPAYLLHCPALPACFVNYWYNNFIFYERERLLDSTGGTATKQRPVHAAVCAKTISQPPHARGNATQTQRTVRGIPMKGPPLIVAMVRGRLVRAASLYMPVATSLLYSPKLPITSIDIVMRLASRPV